MELVFGRQVICCEFVAGVRNMLVDKARISRFFVTRRCDIMTCHVEGAAKRICICGYSVGRLGERVAKRRNGNLSKAKVSRSNDPRGGVPRELSVAKSLMARGEAVRGLTAFRQLLRKYPKSVAVLIESARAFGRRHEIVRCRSLLERASRLAPRQPDVHFFVGETYRHLGYFAEAEASFRRVVALDSNASAASLEMAFLCERAHRLEEAEEWLQRVLRSHSRHPGARLLQARCARRLGDITRADRILLEVANDTDCASVVRAEAWGDVALLYDLASQFDQAWNAIEECKVLQRADATRSLQAAEFVRSRFAQFYVDLKPGDLASWAEGSIDVPGPQISLLTGFPRSGTTLVQQILDAHPAIGVCEERDILSTVVLPRLAPDATMPLHAQIIRRNETEVDVEHCEYRRLLAEGIGEPDGLDCLVDKNPALTPMIPILLRIAPQSRIIVALRDPRDVVLSCFLRYFKVNPVSANFLTVEQTAKRYRFDMERWIAVREIVGSQAVEIRYEDVVADWQSAARAMIDHCGCSWHDRVLDYRAVASRSIVSPSYESVTQPVHAQAIGRWQHYEKQMGAAIEELQPVIEFFGYT